MSKDTSRDHWRQLAAQALGTAYEMTEPEAKAVLFDLAARYARLAQLAEERPDRARQAGPPKL
jgi:hypothetical protein